MQSPEIFVLVSSAGNKVPFLRAVQAAVMKLPSITGVVAGDLNGNAITRFIADRFWCMPPTNDEYREEILKGCQQYKVRVVIPSRDGELEFWARNRTFFESNEIRVVISPLDGIKLCLDKLAFAKFCDMHRFPCIDTALQVDDLPQMERYVVKERFGAGARSIGVGLNRFDAIRHATELVAPIFQPEISGVEISVDGWVDDCGLVRGVVLRTRDVIVSGEAQVTTTFKNAEIEMLVRNVIEALQLRGHVVMQAFMGVEGGVQLIECNARFGGASTASIAVGLDSIFWSLCESLNLPYDNTEFVRLDQEVRQVRVPSDIHEYRSRF